ncbi:hypothetical protein GCM10009754_52780 [Amycolatopsis minnesotensis]|uniref:HEAT repeat domain-containing protein n=2 Tax=Amycolatopsis minnesotensis TaxID=337894 RepID=A0ABP5D2V2_9PSEU
MWSPGEESLADVPDAEALCRLLVTSISARQLTPSVAVDTFRRLHDVGQPGRVDSALLLCTDHRWKRTSGRVLADIVATGILDDAEQDELAEELLSYKARYTHPAEWFNGVVIELDLGAPQEPQRTDPSEQVTSEREVWPPLRSWAAERVLVRNRATPKDVLTRARGLPARDGAAIVAGAVHAADELDAENARLVVDFALQHNQNGPRKAALEQLIAWGEIDRAQALAASDRDASIRVWGENLRTEAPTQSSLFD